MTETLTNRERKLKRELKKAETFLSSGFLADLKDEQGRPFQAWLIPMTRQQVENLVKSQPISEGTR